RCRKKETQLSRQRTKALTIFRFQRGIQGTDVLSIRATATLVDVYLHPEPGQWFSPELNDFLKYERKLGLRGAFVITDSLYQSLSRQAASRFTSRRLVRMQKRLVPAY